MIKTISNAQIKRNSQGFIKIPINSPVRKVVHTDAAVYGKKLSNNSTTSRLKKSAFVAAKKVRLIRSNAIPLDLIRKAHDKVTHSPFRREKKRGKRALLKLRRVYRWVHKKNKNILFRIKLGSAALTKKRYISKRKRQGKLHHATIYVRSTYNNTIFTLLGSGGRTICCISTGMCGFKNTRKSTSYASQVAAQKICTFVKKESPVHIKMRGLGPGKLAGVKALAKTKIRVTNIRECSSLPHNGCRPTKRRRL